MIKTNITVKNTKGETRKIACSKCNRQTNHKLLTAVQLYWDSHGDIQGHDHYETLSCLGCEEISFRLASTNSEDVFMDEDGEWCHPEMEQLFPHRLIGRSPLEDAYLLPMKIRTIYKETHSALSARLKILAGVGIGALIECVCLEEKATGANLKEKIDCLVTNGVLTRNNADILHDTRFLRNRSAHEIQAASDPELSVAFDIIENLLQTIYTIPMKAVGLKKQTPK